MRNLNDIGDQPLLRVWGDEVRARRIEGERITMAVVELAPNAVVPGHTHEQEQLGMVIEGRVTFDLDGEVRELGPGGSWRITSMRPHQVTAGPEGAIVLDVFSPTRRDWDDRSIAEGETPRWPAGD
jgi:quercetin dioxygenase-like cupin family protein